MKGVLMFFVRRELCLLKFEVQYFVEVDYSLITEEIL
jgi:hypothetical protein